MVRKGADFDETCACGNTKERHHSICFSCYGKAKDERLSKSIKKQTILKVLGRFFMGKYPGDAKIREKFTFLLSLLEDK